MVQPSASPAAPPPAEPRRKRRWPRVVAAVVLLAVLLVVLGPIVAAPFVESAAEDALEERLYADARLDGLFLRPSGRARLAQLALDDLEGRPLARIEGVRVDADVLGALRGRVRARVEVAGFELHARRGADGAWNLATLARPAAGEPDDGGDDERDPDEQLREVDLELEARDGRVVLHGESGSTELAGVALTLDLDGLASAAPFRASADVVRRGEDGEPVPAGRVTVEGELTLARDGRVGADTIAAAVDVVVSELALAALEPALAGVARFEHLAGILSADVGARLAPGGALEAQLELRASDLDARAPWTGGEALQLASATASARVALPSAGNGTLSAELVAGDTLRATLEGTLEAAPHAAATAGAPAWQRLARVAADARVNVELGALSEVAPAIARLREGVRLAGRVEADAAFELELTGLEPRRVVAHGSAHVVDLSALDASGEELTTEELRRSRLAYDARADLVVGELELRSLELDLGPVHARASGRAAGLGASGADAGEAGLVVDDARYELTADLERLGATVGRFVDLGGLALGGRIDARGRAELEDGTIAVDATLDAVGVRAARVAPDDGGWSVGPLDVRGEQRARLDLRPGGTSTIDVATLDAGFARWQAAGVLTDLGRPASLAGSIAWGATIEGAELVDALGPLLPFAALDAHLVHGGRIEAQNGRLEWNLELRTDELDVALAAGADEIDATQPLRAHASGLRAELSATRTDDGRHALAGRVALGGAALAGGGLGAAGVELPALALELDATVDAAAGDAAPFALVLSGPGLAGRLAGEARSLRREPSAQARLELTFEPSAWNPAPDARIAGEPLYAAITFGLENGAATARGTLEAQRLNVVLPADGGAAREVEQREVTLALDVTASRVRIEARELRYRSSTLDASARGTIAGLDEPASATADVDVDVRAALERLLADLGAALGVPEGASARGELALQLDVGGEPGAWKVDGEAVAHDLDLVVPASEPGRAPLQWREDEVTLEIAALVHPGEQRADVRRAAIESSAVRGDATATLARESREGAEDALLVRGLEGRLVYVPDRLGAVLGPWLPGQLSGAEEQECTFAFDGELAALDPLALLRSTRGRSTLELGLLALAGLETTGRLELLTATDRATATGDLVANGGTLRFEATADLRAGAQPGEARPRSTARVTLDDVRARGEAMGTLLARVHPIFAAARAQSADPAAEGLVTAQIELVYDGALDWRTLAQDPSGLALAPLSGSCSLRVDQARVERSSLLGQMLSVLGVDEHSDMDVRPIELTLERGRLRYANPWTWTIGETETSFTGTIGLDGTLALSWNVPITKALVARTNELAVLEGQTIEVPLAGTLEDPRLGWSELLPELLMKAAKARIAEELPGGLGGLFSGKGGLLGPADVLGQADALWDAGERKKARELYGEIRAKHRFTLVYLANKDRIEERQPKD